DAETLRQLAVLQRRHPDAALFETLLALGDLTNDDLGVLYEAAQVALEVVVDRARAIEVLERLLTAARPRWDEARNALPTLPPSSAPPSVTVAEQRPLTADSFARWAVDRLVELHGSANEHEAAISVLVRGAALPFEEEASRTLRHRAAEIATASLPGSVRAIELYREILAGAPGDQRAIAALARLYEGEEMFTELAALRRHELGLARTTEARLPLRLDLARVLGLAGEIDAQLDALRENLEEQPGHEDTIERAAEVLEAAARHAELAHLLSEQALLLEAASESQRAALLWARVAKLSEESLADVPRALASWGRVVALQPTAEAFDALARLHAARRESAVAIEWLEKRLAATPVGERATTVARLAEEHLRAGDRARAIEVLELGLEGEPNARPLRERLVALHRETSDWGLVAQLLRDGATHEDDPAKRVAWLREAANLYVQELNDPEGAVPLFAEAAQVGDSRPLRVELADALRRANRHDEAHKILDELVEWYGRRRPPERAQVHVQLAHLARARGDSAEALSQLELASSMDMGSAQILRDLGSLARESGDYARAERAYRALLLIVRRPGVQLDTVIGPSEVLFELHRIAAALGQEDRARENLESAFEASSQSEAEGRRFVQLLRESGNEAFLVRALEARVAAIQDPAAAAATLVELADVLDGMGRVDDALQARLDALAHVPESLPLHAGVRDVARRAGKLERYQDRLRELADRARAGGEAATAAAFLLRLGEVFEQDAGDLTRAAEAYAEAESTGEQAVSALEALARLARGRSDREAELTALRKLVQIDDQDAQKRTEGLYRLADLLLATQEGRDEGADMLAWAIDREPQLDRALAILRAVPGTDEKIAGLHERVARAGGDQAVLLEALERVAASESPSFELLREAADLAVRLEEPARAEKLL
ncbi:MAG: tetratricopeptide repeat protein, partial [Polyangiales bacterium]